MGNNFFVYVKEPVAIYWQINLSQVQSKILLHYPHFSSHNMLAKNLPCHSNQLHSFIRAYELMLCLQGFCHSEPPRRVDCLTLPLVCRIYTNTRAVRWRYFIKSLTQERNKRTCRFFLTVSFVLSDKQERCELGF